MSHQRHLSAAAPHALLTPAFRDAQHRRRREDATRQAAEAGRRADRMAAALGDRTRAADPELAAAVDNAATALRTLGTLLLADPTLADDTGSRCHAVNLALIMDGQLAPMLRQLQRRDNRTAAHRAELRAGTLLLLGRFPEQAALLRAAVRNPACPDHSQELSLERLRDASGRLASQLDQALEARLAAALALPHPHPEAVDIAVALAELAARLRAYEEDQDDSLPAGA